MRALLLAAIAAAPPVMAKPFSATDTMGRDLSFDAVPTRVVTVDAAAFGLLAALGVMPVGTVVGADRKDNPYYFGDATAVPEVGTHGWQPDAELIAAVAPDLVVGWTVEDAPLFDGIAPYYSVAGLTDLASYLDTLRDVAGILDRAPEAEAAIAAWQARAAAYAALAPDRPTVVFAGTDGEQFWINTVADPTCRILDLVATCDWANPDPLAPNYQTSVEGLMALDPEVILIEHFTGAGDVEMLATLAALPLWPALSAVRAGRVHIVPPGAVASYSVPGFTQTLDTVAPLIHPDTFPAPLTDAQVAAALQE